MLRGKDRRLVELKAVLEFWRSFTRQHPELEDRVFREVLWNHLHGEVSTQIGVSRVTGIARATVLRRMHELEKAGKLVREDRGYYISGPALSACSGYKGLDRSIDLIKCAAAGRRRLRGADGRRGRVIA